VIYAPFGCSDRPQPCVECPERSRGGHPILQTFPLPAEALCEGGKSPSQRQALKHKLKRAPCERPGSQSRTGEAVPFFHCTALQEYMRCRRMVLPALSMIAQHSCSAKVLGGTSGHHANA